ncbi:MAG: NUDIX hydrolase [Ginsengibacter sp.]
MAGVLVEIVKRLITAFVLHSKNLIELKNDICVGGFLLRNNRFLFGKRSRKKLWAPGVWDIVGGHSLENEHPLYTLQRETLEEFGIKVLNAEMITVLDVWDESVKGYFKYFIYHITHYKGKPFNNSKEHKKIKWFTREELGELPLALSAYLEMIDNGLRAEPVQEK